LSVNLLARCESYAEPWMDLPSAHPVGVIAGCVVLGLTAIAAGWAIVPDANHTGYGAGVLTNVGTTLLLVGIVVLLERRRLRRADPRPRGADPHELGSVDAEAEARRMADEYSGCRPDLRNTLRSPLVGLGWVVQPTNLYMRCCRRQVLLGAVS